MNNNIQTSKNLLLKRGAVSAVHASNFNGLKDLTNQILDEGGKKDQDENTQSTIAKNSQTEPLDVSDFFKTREDVAMERIDQIEKALYTKDPKDEKAQK